MPTYEFDFSVEKNLKLKKERKISFEEIIHLIENGHIIDILEHPNQDRYSNQKIFIILIKGYTWFVPYVEKPEGKIFLKTAFPNRKYNKHFGGTEYGK